MAAYSVGYINVKKAYTEGYVTQARTNTVSELYCCSVTFVSVGGVSEKDSQLTID